MDPLHIFERITELAHASIEVQGRVRSILEFLVEALGFDIATLYVLEADAKTLHPSDSNLGKSFVFESGSFSMGEGIVGTSAQEATPVWFGSGDEKNHRTQQWKEDFPGYETMVAFPVAVDLALVGVVLMLHRKPRRVEARRVQILSLVGRQIARLLRDAKREQDLKDRLHELTALSEISRVASGPLELEPLLDMIVRTAVEVMGAAGGVIRVLEERTNIYQIASTYGNVPYTQYPQQVLHGGTKSQCAVARTGRPFLFDNSQVNPSCQIPLNYQLATCLCVPLREGDRTIGVLSVYGAEERFHRGDAKFGKGDVKLLEAMAGHISAALSRAIQHQEVKRLVAEKEAMVRELSILQATSAAMMKTIHMERLLRVTLMAITLGDGLGFNRAMLFLVNEEKGVLEGRFGVGPGSAEEAARIWEEVKGEKRSLPEWLDWALEQSNWIGEESPVHRLARRIRIPLDDEKCLLARVIREKKAFRKEFSDELYGMERMRPLELGEQFACVPVIARGEPLGAILVDNLYNARPIGDSDLRFLSALASQAGLSIQNARLYERLKKANEEIQSVQQRLIHSERLATLGEFSASIAHEIRNPLVSIGGYARLLQKQHQDVYSQIIYEEVERLEEILSRILSFSRKTVPAEREVTDLNVVMENIIRSLGEEIKLKHVKIEKELSQSLPNVTCDQGQIKQVFMNLIQNAIDAMGEKGTLTIRTHVVSDGDGLWVASEVSDTGKGIPSDVINNIFNPFFTTKEKGTGLGLAIIQRFVDAHSGKIEINNRPGEGTTFRVLLPASF
jgi:two-component system sensor histidine kinase HydH